MEQTNVGKGSLSKNRSATHPKAPGYTGSITFDHPIAAGQKLWLSAWLNDGDNGKYFSLRAALPSGAPASTSPYPASSQPPYNGGRVPARPRSMDELMDDDIPF